MGCGCGGGKGTVGMNRSNPIILGEDSPESPATRVYLLQGSGGAPAGSRRWVRGTEVQDLLDSGALRPA